jgi:hypothetical protein
MTDYILISTGDRHPDPNINKFKEQFEDYWRHLNPEIRKIFKDREFDPPPDNKTNNKNDDISQ